MTHSLFESGFPSTGLERVDVNRRGWQAIGGLFDLRSIKWRPVEPVFQSD